MAFNYCKLSFIIIIIIIVFYFFVISITIIIFFVLATIFSMSKYYLEHDLVLSNPTMEFKHQDCCYGERGHCRDLILGFMV